MVFSQSAPPSRPVIVVGASLVGLSAALCLSAQKVPTLVLERHAGISKHPRVIGYTARTMEIFNTLGIVDQIPQASYLIAADGNRSTVRELLGITQQGRGHMQTLRSVLFRASLEQYLQGVHQFNIEQHDFKAFMTTYNDGRWVLMFHDDIERDEETLLSSIHQAIGKSDLPIELITTGRWEMEALVADTFQSGRVFLAGDAAHTLPPNRGGYGANTGIADVHNLGWKIAAVLSGISSPTLLDTYDTERRPVELLRHDQIFARADFKMHLHKETPASEVIDDNAMELGQLYASKGFISLHDKLPAALKPDEWAGQPGTRMPHLWGVRKGRSVSVHDTMDGVSWTLFSEAEEWRGVVGEVERRLSLPTSGVQIGKDIVLASERAFQDTMGVSGTGAALVRPDGYIAWRISNMPSEPVQVLSDALDQVAMADGWN